MFSTATNGHRLVRTHGRGPTKRVHPIPFFRLVASALHLIAGGARSTGPAVAHRPTLEEAVGPTQYGEAIEDRSFLGPRKDVLETRG
jgi:hypothetical protein